MKNKEIIIKSKLENLPMKGVFQIKILATDGIKFSISIMQDQYLLLDFYVDILVLNNLISQNLSYNQLINKLQSVEGSILW